MTLGLVMGLPRYFLNINSYFKSKFAVRCKPGYRFPHKAGGGKSGQYRAMHR